MLRMVEFVTIFRRGQLYGHSGSWSPSQSITSPPSPSDDEDSTLGSAGAPSWPLSSPGMVEDVDKDIQLGALLALARGCRFWSIPLIRVHTYTRTRLYSHLYVAVVVGGPSWVWSWLHVSGIWQDQ